MIFAGFDTAGRSLCLLDASGQPVADVPLGEGWWGLRQLHGLLADLGRDAYEVVVGLAQQRGLMVELLAGAGYRVFALSDSTVDLCRLLRSVTEGSEPSRAAVMAGLVHSLHPNLQPLSAPASLAGHACHYRQLAWARRHQQQRLSGLLGRRSAGGGRNPDADLDRPGGLQRLVEAPGVGGRVGSQPLDPVSACLAALTDLDRRLDELERRLVEALSPPATGSYEGWRGGEEAARSTGPASGALRAWPGRAGVTAAAVVGLSLGLVAPDSGPSTTPGAGTRAPPPPPGPVDSNPDGVSALWLSGAPIPIVLQHPGAPTAAHPGAPMTTGGPDERTAELRPVGVEVPAIDLVTPPLVELGLTAEGGLEVPVEFARAGWYADSAVPGSPGPAVMVGHYDSRRGPAVFYRLAELTPGDAVTISLSDGGRETFLVERVARYHKDRFPTEDVYGHTREPTLRLITCGGRFDRATGHYEENLVVFAGQAGG